MNSVDDVSLGGLGSPGKVGRRSGGSMTIGAAAAAGALADAEPPLAESHSGSHATAGGFRIEPLPTSTTTAPRYRCHIHFERGKLLDIEKKYCFCNPKYTIA